jgi:hypothetical protein
MIVLFLHDVSCRRADVPANGSPAGIRKRELQRATGGRMSHSINT